ncbi:MAG: amino acid transporter substrate-binding protein, partial [Phycisphaerales bacterium]|nr:amino acid transporter substrate-binding protein [Phycisphaerales bacterium]
MTSWRIRNLAPILALCACAIGSPRVCGAAEQLKVGSKVFTESVILGELATQLGRDAGFDTVHRSQLGGTRVLWDALLHGDIDAYPEYTGTIVQELLPGTPLTEDALRAALAGHGVGVTRSLGFNDTYALGMTEALAARLDVRTIADLGRHP